MEFFCAKTMNHVSDAERRRLCAALMILPVLLAAKPAQAKNDFNEAIGWLGLTEGLIAARAVSKPIFLLIHADWCPACRSYRRLFHRSAVVSKLSAYVPVLIDGERDKSAERRFRPDGSYIPRSLLLSPQGKHYKDITGPHKSKYFLPTKKEAHLLDYLDRGLTRASGGAVPRNGAVRRSVPGDGEGPSFKRPDVKTRTGDGGPKRLRAPGADQAQPEPQSNLAPSPTPEPAR